jgi:hypothetical protein
MADFQPDPPSSRDAEARALLRLNARPVAGPKLEPAGKGARALGGKRVGSGPRGGSL